MPPQSGSPGPLGLYPRPSPRDGCRRRRDTLRGISLEPPARRWESTPWQEGFFCPDFHATNAGEGHMAYAIWIELPVVPSGAIVVQKSADLNEHEALLNSVSYPMEPRADSHRGVSATDELPTGRTYHQSFVAKCPRQPALAHQYFDRQPYRGSLPAGCRVGVSRRTNIAAPHPEPTACQHPVSSHNSACSVSSVLCAFHAPRAVRGHAIHRRAGPQARGVITAACFAVMSSRRIH